MYWLLAMAKYNPLLSFLLTRVGTDGLHPNAFGEFQIASVFSKTLVKDFGLGKDPIKVPSQDDSALARALPQPSNFQVFSSPQGVTATWDPGKTHLELSSFIPSKPYLVIVIMIQTDS